jgi:MFS family permease
MVMCLRPSLQLGLKMEPEPEPEPRVAPREQQNCQPPPPPPPRQQQFTVNALAVASLTRNLAISVRNLSEQEIWLSAYGGDFAAQARAQGLLESASGVLGFVVNPLLGAVSDSCGRKPLMNLAPLVSVASCSVMAWRPGVPALVMRRFCSPLSNTPWHSGENACLADLFKGDSTAYGLAKSKINTMISVVKIAGPILGGYLAAISISLPWWCVPPTRRSLDHWLLHRCISPPK